MITLKDIAKEAGVSVMTVSRVINGSNSKISKETSQKIIDIAKKNGYVPNSSARSLVLKSSRIVSVIIRTTGGNPFIGEYTSMMFGNIAYYANLNGYHTMVHYINDYRDITKHLRSWNSEGAIFIGTFDKDIMQIQEDNQIPLVFTDSYSPDRQITNVGIDDYRGGVLVAKHFIARGHRSFAFVRPNHGPNFSGSMHHRLQGFKDTITNEGLSLPPENILVTDDNNSSVADKIIHLKDPVTAIFAAFDMIAIKLIDEMTQIGIKIPEDYSIIGFDNFPISYYITPKLTTIVQDVNRKAQLASEILFKHISDNSLPAENIFLNVSLVERDSVRTIKR